MISPISNLSFQAYPNKFPDKVKIQKYNQQLANGKTTELFAKNEVVEKSIPKKKSKKEKFLTTAFLTLATVVGLAVLGNKSSNFMATLGQKVDDKLLNKKWYQNLEKFLGNCKKKVSNFFFNNKNSFIKNSALDLKETLTKRHAKPTLDIARGYGRGFSSIFGLTPVDVLTTSLTKIEKKSPGQALKSLEKLVGKDRAGFYFDKFINGGKIVDNQEFCTNLTKHIAEHFNMIDKTGKIDTKKLLGLFKDIEKGKVNNIDFSEFTKVKMDQGGWMSFMSSWWPVNLIDNIGNKCANLFGKKWNNIGRGNLGDALTKFNVVNGTLSKTKAGSLVQQAITVPTESVSNFVNDKSGMGALLGLSIASLYNNAQDAPKGKRSSMVMNDYLGTLAAFTITTPLAFNTTYALASLKNLEGKTWLTKALKQAGKLFGLGHKQIGLDGKFIESTCKNKFLNTLTKNCGHVLRFALIMFVFNSLFGELIRKGIEKIFGKPYDIAEEAKKQKEEELLAQQQALSLAQKKPQVQK